MTRKTATDAAQVGAPEATPEPGQEMAAESTPETSQRFSPEAQQRAAQAASPPETPTEEHHRKALKRPSGKSEVSEEHFLRAITSFEAILVTRESEKKYLATRISWNTRAGITILGLIAISILILLLALSIQIKRISAVVADMNKEFTLVSSQMERIRGHVSSMSQRVALLDGIQGQTEVMNREMADISGEMGAMSNTIAGVSGHVAEVRGDIDRISMAINQMNSSVQLMGHDMYRMGKPAQTMNKMFPFP